MITSCVLLTLGCDPSSLCLPISSSVTIMSGSDLSSLADIVADIRQDTHPLPWWVFKYYIIMHCCRQPSFGFLNNFPPPENWDPYAYFECKNNLCNISGPRYLRNKMHFWNRLIHIHIVSYTFFFIRTWLIRTWGSKCQKIRTFLRTLTRLKILGK